MQVYGRCLPMLPAAILAGLLTAPTRADDRALAREMMDAFDRCESRVMVRQISPRRALLDTRVYWRNPILHYPLEEAPEPPADVPDLDELDFGGALDTGEVFDAAAELAKAKRKEMPLAWEPLTKHLSEWDWDAALPLLEAGAKISEEKWGNDDLVYPLQQIAIAHLYGDEIWVMVEFRPELTWLPVTDDDGDGYPELYARLNVGDVSKVIEQLRAEYIPDTLDAEALEQYFFELASDWYQAYRTETLEPEDSRPWPNADTEPDIVELMGGKLFERPFAVMKAKPYGEVIYNVYILPDDQARVPVGSRYAQGGDVTLQPNPYQAELQEFGGSYEAWSAGLADFHADVEAQLDARPKELSGLIGKDGFLFFRGDLEYLVSGELRGQPDGRDPCPAIIDFHEQLSRRGIELLVVLIPTKAEVFPEKISDKAPAGAKPYVAPYGRKLASELTEVGVQLVDLLPAFIEQREVDGQPLYMPADTHWTPRGLQLAAKLIADRIRRCPSFVALRPNVGRFTTQAVECTRRGDICDMLTDSEKLKYPPLKLTAEQVLAPDGSLYEDDPESPIVVLGDSFTGVFHYEDCEHAGLSAHLARKLRMSVDLIMAQGSGPKIRGRLARRGAEAIDNKKIVVWTCVTRDLYNYWAPWDLIELP